MKIDSDSEGEDDVAGGVLSGAGGKLGGSLTNVSSVDWESELPAKQQQVQRALSR